MEDLTSMQTYQTLISSNVSIILFFWAEFYAPSKVGGQVYDIVKALSEKYTTVKFYRIEAEDEEVIDLSKKYEVSTVPTFVAIHNGRILGTKVEGANPSNILQLVKGLITAQSAPPSENISSNSVISKEDLNNKLSQLVKSSPVMLFIKGSPSAPKCGFSRTIVEILQTHQIPFSSFDILTDNTIREGLKTYSEWPTYPQLYVSGEFVGGLDIVKELVNSGKPLAESLGIDKIRQIVQNNNNNNNNNKTSTSPTTTSSTTTVDSKEQLNNRLKQLILQDKVMLFMKGAPDAPKCGFSRTIVEILQNNQINFSTFDILSDEDVRSGLKVYSDWPTYPQLYCKGELVGGLDIVKDMVAQAQAGTSDNQHSLAAQLGL